VQITHKTFRNIGLLGRPDKSSVVETLCLIHDHLVSRGLHPVFDQETAQLVPYTDPQTVSRALLGEIVDLVIVVGGDGSLLHAARALVHHNTPVIGVNRGRLGFLTDIKPSEVIFKLDQVLRGEFQLDRRFLLEMEIRSQGNIIYNAIALNDMVLQLTHSQVVARLYIREWMLLYWCQCIPIHYHRVQLLWADIVKLNWLYVKIV